MKKNLELLSHYMESLQENKEYLYKMYEVDKEVMGDNIDIEKFLLYVNVDLSMYTNMKNSKKVFVLYDGDPYKTFKVVISSIVYGIEKVVLFPNKNYLGLCSYLVKCFDKVKEEHYNISIDLDIGNNYNHYLSHLDLFDKIFYVGDKDSFSEVINDFNNKIILIED